jgi:glycosidase
MNTRTSHPVVYEINTWVWLGELSRQYGTTITLGSVPQREWDALADLGMDALWLMGVWERSPAGRRIAMENQGLVADFRRALPDFSPADNVGSPYCIRNYHVDGHLGGPGGLMEARRRLTDRHIALILDFVPNHAAPDHAWVSEHPEYFIQGDVEDVRNDPGSFRQVGSRFFACGRDPHYPAWPDVLQLNTFHPGARRALTETVLSIAGQCDGVRCDMAMLVMNPVFTRTWGARAGAGPEREFWPGLIHAVHRRYPGFLFMAEAYWDLEWELQQQGFDFCYDKRLYDRLDHGNAEGVRLHLCAERAYQDKLVRFIENHDEPRAASAFPAQKSLAAAVAMATLPGARLFHEGQIEGKKVRLPVFLGRRPHEPIDPQIRAFYDVLLQILKSDCFKNGRWRLCERISPSDPSGEEALVSWRWNNDAESYLIVVNLSDHAAKGRTRLQELQEHERNGRLWTDLFSGTVHEIERGELSVDLPAWGFHVLKDH